MINLKHSATPVIVLLMGSTLWGLSWIPLKALESLGIGGIFLNFVSYGILTILFAPIFFKNSHYFSSHLKALSAMAFFGGLANLCFTYALIYGDIIRVMVLFYLLPVWGVLGGFFVLKEKTDLWRWLGVVIAIVGAFILLGGNKIIDQPPSWIDLVAILSGFAVAANNIVYRATATLPLQVKLGVTFLGCTVMALLLLFIGVEPFPRDFKMDWLLYLALFALGWLLVTNIMSQWSVTQMPAGRSSLIIIFELIAAVVSAMLLRGEQLSAVAVIGGLMVLSATAVEIFRPVQE